MVAILLCSALGASLSRTGHGPSERILGDGTLRPSRPPHRACVQCGMGFCSALELQAQAPFPSLLRVFPVRVINKAP